MPAAFLQTPLCRWLLCAVLWLGHGMAWGESYQALDESLHTVFTALSVPMGLPIVVSREVARKRLRGVLDLAAPQQSLERLAQQQGLIWYGDGQAIHVYDATEAKSSAVALRHLSIDRFRSLMRRSGLDETRYPLRASGGRTFYVSGPPNYVDQVLRLAQLMDRQRADLRVGNQAFGVVQVLNTHVADREYTMGERTLRVAGIASTIETLLAGERKGLLADKALVVIAYADTNSLLIKGNPAQVRFIEQLVTELDTPKRAIEVSLWLVDVGRDALSTLRPAWADNSEASTSAVMEPLEDNRLMARLAVLERRRRAKVVALPVILTQENVPAVFNDNRTFHLPPLADDAAGWKPVPYATQVSVLPRFAEANEIEMLLEIEDARPINDQRRGSKPDAVARIGVSSVVRVPHGKRLWLAAFPRDSRERDRGRASAPSGEVRLFVIQARAVAGEERGAAAAGGPPPLTAAQYERVQRAFVRPGLDVFP